MNERIRELMIKADYPAPELALRAQALVEFIVKECVAICQDIDGEDNIDAMSGRQDCAVEILEHFGVEE